MLFYQLHRLHVLTRSCLTVSLTAGGCHQVVDTIKKKCDEEMSTVTAVLLLLKRYLLTVVGVIRRGLCCRRILRRNSGSPLLPTTIRPTDTSVQAIPSYSAGYLHQPQFSQYSQSQLQTFQSWDSPVPVSETLAPSHRNGVDIGTNQEEDGVPAEEDFFSDMRPQLRQQKKILLKQTNHADECVSQATGHRGNKFSVDASAVIAPSRELGDLDEEVDAAAWNEEELDMEQTIRAAREADRRRRQEENEERSRVVRDHKSARKSLTATRLS